MFQVICIVVLSIIAFCQMLPFYLGLAEKST